MDEEEEDSDLGLGDDSFEFPEWKAAPEDVKDDEDDEDDEQGSGSCVGRKGGRQQRQLVKVGPPRPAGGGQERSRSTSDGGREDEEERERETFRLVGRLFGGRRVFPGPRREAEGATLKVSTPFCPFWGPERHDFEAFKAAKMASWWRSDLRVAKRSKNFGAGLEKIYYTVLYCCCCRRCCRNAFVVVVDLQCQSSFQNVYCQRSGQRASRASPCIGVFPDCGRCPPGARACFGTTHSLRIR